MPADPPASQPPEDSALHGNDLSGLLRCALGTPLPFEDFQPGLWEPSPAAHIGDMLPAWEILGLIGRGGMGAVYKGRRRALNRIEAIKILPVELSHNEEFVARFEREAQTLASLNHPGIVTIYDFGKTADDHFYIVMEYVEGTDLHRIIHGPKLAVDHALRITVQVCEALQYAHERGIIHRDIKPANVILTAEGRAKLADFGLALKPAEPAAGHAPVPGTPDVTGVFDGHADNRLTRAGAALGTPVYAAPEMYEGTSDRRSDIYALGVMLYEMLTGRPPEDHFPLPSTTGMDRRLDGVIIKALEDNPADRYQSATEMQADVEEVLPPRPASSASALVAPAPSPPLRRRTWRRLAGGFSLFLIPLLGLPIAWLLDKGWQKNPALVSHLPAWVQARLPAPQPSPPAAVPAPAVVPVPLPSPQKGPFVLEPGFTDLFDDAHRPAWKHCGPGDFLWNNGIFTTTTPVGANPHHGVHWYSRQMFGDFVLKIEFKLDARDSNSGLLLRFTDTSNPESVDTQCIEVDIHDYFPDRLNTGSIDHSRLPVQLSMNRDDWNEFEITAKGLHYAVKLNGQPINEYISSRRAVGYIGLQNLRAEGEVHFRHCRIQAAELPPAPPESPAVSTPDQRPPRYVPGWTHAEQDAFEKTLFAYEWFIPDRKWNLQFRPGHKAHVQEGNAERIWHWWLIGPRTLHIQFAAMPAKYDPAIGETYIFDEKMTKYDSGPRTALGIRGRPITPVAP